MMNNNNRVEQIYFKYLFNKCFENIMNEICANDSSLNLKDMDEIDNMYIFIKKVMENEDDEEKSIISKNYDILEKIHDDDINNFADILKNIKPFSMSEKDQEMMQYISELEKTDDKSLAINKLEELENRNDKNYEIFYDKYSNKYVIADSRIWETLSRIGFEMIDY